MNEQQAEQTSPPVAAETPPPEPAGPRPVRQERLPASEEVVEVAPGVLRLQLPVSMPGLGHVNCYAIEDRKGVTLVDPGLPGPSSWRALNARLNDARLPIERVHTVVITHSHPDHYGGAHRLRAKYGAEIVTHADFKTSWDPDEEDDQHKDIADRDGEEERENALDRFRKLRRDSVRAQKRWSQPAPWGGRSPAPPTMARIKYATMGIAAPSFFVPPKASKRVVDGQVIVIGDREWVSLHTPGHTVDHLCLLEPNSGTLLSGDHVLPTITPHISGMSGSADPLAQFFDSLDRMHTLDGVDTVLPAHGHPFDDLSGRVTAIQEHHHERLDIIRESSAALGAGTVEEYTQHLFKPRSWGTMAESEAYAHLEHLRCCGEATTTESPEGIRYSF